MTSTPAAADTLRRYREDTGTPPSDYDAVFSGDLGVCGSALLKELLAQKRQETYRRAIGFLQE